MIRKDRIIVKHLSEDKTVQSIPGELIISLVSGHISVKGDVFTYSITKDIEASIVNIDSICKLINEKLSLLERDSIEDNTLLDNNYDIKDLTTIVTYLEEKIEDMENKLNNAIGVLNDISLKMNPLIEKNENNSMKIKDDLVNNFFNNKLPKYNEAESLTRECEERYNESKHIYDYFVKMRNLCNKAKQELDREYNENIEKYKQLVSKDEYNAYVENLKNRYKSLEAKYPGTTVNVQIIPAT